MLTFLVKALLYRTAWLSVAFVPAGRYSRGYSASKPGKRQKAQQAGTNEQTARALASFALDFDIEATG